MVAHTRCADCGESIQDGMQGAICPQCLLKGALELGSDTIVTGPRPPPDGSGALGTGRRFGDYELIEEIARGGMGIVYRARQVSLDRLVAVKVLLRGDQATDEMIRRFRIEAAVTASLHHPNIVAVHEVGVHQDQHFLAMDLVEGPSMARVLRNGPLPAKQAAEWVKIIAEAIDFAHTRHILHRDIKPSNVLIDADGRPRVTDFGLAKNLATDSKLTLTGQVYGSPSYMPPEQARGQRGVVAVTSDVYSLGALLYHAITGRPPFVGQTVTETLRQVELADPVTPRLLNPVAPRDLETICLKCLRKEPGRRYASASDLAEELGRFLRNEPIHARPVSRPEKVWRWGRRNPLAAAFVGTVCVALISSLGLLFQVNDERAKQTRLAEELKQAMREKDGASRRTLVLLGESLEGIWANSGRRSLPLKSEDVAALMELPVVPVTNRATVVRWKMGLVTDEDPMSRVSRYAMLLSRLEDQASRILGREVKIDVRLYKFQQDFGADLCAGVLDFGRLGARHFIQLRRSHPGLKPLVMPTTNYKEGILFTRTNTGIRSIPEIRGRSVAFGDTNSTISYWAQIKLAQQGIAATNLARYDFLDSTLDFADEVLDVGHSNAVSRIGYLHSHAQVIEGVLDGRYDVGVAHIKAFHIHKDRGLVAIPNSQFQSSRNVLAAGPDFGARFVDALVEVMTQQRGYWLEKLPDASPSYAASPANAYAIEEEWFERIGTFFPLKPAPPRFPVSKPNAR